jgi:16S rRNA (uracil1498-N3)-methyltransferase
MPAERFFYNNLLKETQMISLGEEETFHLLKVMRTKPGELVEIINGQSQLGYARLKEHGQLYIERLIEQPVPKEGLILCVAMPKFNRIEWIIEKGTELGVVAFWLFEGDLSEKSSLSEQQRLRLSHLAISAIKQCGRLDLPKIELKPPLAKWQKPQGTLLFGDTSENASPIHFSYQLPIYFFSGPEKGFGKKELDLLNKWEAKGVSLNRNILRADTAPIVAAAILGNPC